MVRRTILLGTVVVILLATTISFAEAAGEMKISGTVEGRRGDAVNINRYPLGYMREGGDQGCHG